jgi:hypothetical protein
MDSLHERLARLALSAAGDYGFCLAGGYAVQAHGFLDRPSEDVDLFTTSAAEEQFPEALTTVIAAYKGDGLDVSTTAEGPGFARLQVTDPTTRATAKVELGIDWRAHQPVTLAIGPVLHPDDAVANKVCAVFSRAQARDYIDVDAVLQSGRYTSDELLALAPVPRSRLRRGGVRDRTARHPPPAGCRVHALRPDRRRCLRAHRADDAVGGHHRELISRGSSARITGG